MKRSLLQARCRIRITIQAILLLLFPFFSQAQTFIGVSGSPVDNATAAQAGPTATIITPGGMAAGDLVIIYAHYKAAAATLSITTTGGQTWTNETTASSGTQTFSVFWCRYNGTWAANPIVTASGANALTAVMYVYRPASGTNSWAIHAPATNSTANAAPVPIAGLTTTVPNTVTMAFWGSENDNTWATLTGAGWSKTGLSAQYRNTTGTDQSHSAAYNIRTTAGAVATVSQTQSAVAPTQTSIVSWMEIATPANDLCANAVTLVSNPVCSNTSGTLTDATYNALASLGCGAANVNDVWYNFTAKTTNPTITLSSYPTNSTIQLFSGACPSPTPVASGCSSTGTLTTSGLTIGTTYRIRVYSSTNAAGTFNICVTDPPPANDECSGAISLTAGTACANTTTNIYAASASTTPIAPCTGPVVFDIWYRFIAPATNANIALSSIGTAIGAANVRTQLFSGDCDGGLTSIGCGTTALAAATLTPGNYYYVRVYSIGTAPTSRTNADLSICVTYTPPVIAPTNDICTNAITLPVNNTCVKTLGTIVNATATSTLVAPAPTCGAAANIDVWYRFVAESANTTISLGNFGTNFGSARIQLLQGTCGGFTQLSCVAGNTMNATGLTPTNTYYIRVLSNVTPTPNSFGDFSICVYNTANPVRVGNSYVNITKQTTGGVVEPGDILEIRMTVNLSSGTIDRIRYVDNVPTNTAMLTAATDRLRVLSNEGIPVEEFTLGGGDDGGHYKSVLGAGEYNVRMNLNFNATTTPPSASAPTTNTDVFTTADGQLTAGNVPNVFGSTLFATAFRVQVTGAVGGVITLGTGKFLYRSGASNLEFTTIPYQILISSPMSLCANSTGVNMSEEFGGTFGTGTTQNRGTDLNSPITGYDFVETSAFQSLGDRQYSIVKNMSPRSGTLTNAERSPNQLIPLPSQLSYVYRMHDGHWDIDGDHSGTNNLTGNAPTAEGASGGYMLMVNADYVASETYRQTLNNLCPDTYYEFSAWFRNICPTCGNNYATGNNYTPRQPGVMPNLTFTLDGLDRYSTGEIPYYSSGTTANGWVKKGFVFRTGPTQTSASFTIRNNSQGGGGNDWAMDDVAIATCLPNMSYTPSTAPAVCMNNALVVDNTITSFFNSYNHYKWQRRANGSPTWTDIAGQTGSTTPTAVAGQWQYMISYTIPPANTTLANNGDQYRVIVSTSTTNLSDASCQVTDGISQITLTVNNCNPVLGTNIISFNANAEAGNAVLRWTTDKETEPFQFIIERSTDGVKFVPVATVSSSNDFDNSLNTYNWSEPYAQGRYYYRVKMISNLNGQKYSKIAGIGSQMKAIESVSIVNPFATELVTNLQVANATNATLQLVDNSGRVVRTQNYILQAGANRVMMDNVKSLSQGFYTIRITVDQNTITKKLLKQ